MESATYIRTGNRGIVRMLYTTNVWGLNYGQKRNTTENQSKTHMIVNTHAVQVTGCMYLCSN